MSRKPRDGPQRIFFPRADRSCYLRRIFPAFPFLASAEINAENQKTEKNQRIKLPFNSWLLTFLLALQSTNIHTPKHLYVCMHEVGPALSKQHFHPPGSSLPGFAGVSWLPTETHVLL